MLTKNEFVEKVIEMFPSTESELLDEDYSFSISRQMGCFKRFIQKAIDMNDISLLKKCFAFIDSLIGNVTPDVENAIYISCLSKLDFSKNSKAFKVMPVKLQSVVEQTEEYIKKGPSGKALEFLNGLE